MAGKHCTDNLDNNNNNKTHMNQKLNIRNTCSFTRSTNLKNIGKTKFTLFIHVSGRETQTQHQQTNNRIKIKNMKEKKNE